MRKREKRNRKKQDRGIFDFMMVTDHFFHSLRKWILEMDDPKNSSYTAYSQADLNMNTKRKIRKGKSTERGSAG